MRFGWSASLTFHNITDIIGVLLEKEEIAMLNTDTISRQYISSEVRFYTITDLQEMLGWSPATIHKLFNDPKFPSADFGKQKVVEAHALIDYFSKRHEKEMEKHWR